MTFRSPLFSLVAAVLAAVITFAPRAFAEPTESLDVAEYQQTVAKAIAYFKTKGQDADGSFSAYAGPAVTALAAAALMENGVPPTDPTVAKALKYVISHVQPSGGIHAPDSLYKNYGTCVAILCLTKANRDGRYDKAIERAKAFIKGLQWDEGEGKDKSDPAFGGAGYGKHKRPDLSNTSFFVEALHAAGVGPEEEAMKRALIFVSRCQNLETEHNTTPFAAKNPDGGFYYTCAAGGSSQAGETPEGGLRSYASMTYAGLKSMIFAGVGPDDPRVEAATEWISQHYGLESNPGMGNNGLYYYYHTFAKALDALEQDEFKDAEGKTHNWRAELAAELAQRQNEDGSWQNENSRWLEGDRNLVTAYSLLALAYCKPQEQR